MIAILGGLGAALAWAVSTLCSSRSARLMDPVVVVACVMLVGLVITIPEAVLAGAPATVPASAYALLALAGVGNVLGLLLTYHAMRIGQVSLIAPLISTEGAIAALIALFAGETLAPSVGVTLVAIAAGVVLASVPASGPDEDHPEPARAKHPRTVALAVVAALSFGASLYATGRAGTELPSSWVVLSARLVGTVALALPLALTGRLKLAREALWLLVASGVCEVLGFYAYTAGARHGIAVAAVLSSQFAALSVLGAYLFFSERLTRIQLAGVLLVVAGVALLTAVRA